MERIFIERISEKLSLKITNAVKCVAQCSIYSTSIYTDYNTAQTLTAALFHFFTQEDVESSFSLLALMEQVPQLRSTFIKKWLRDDFNFDQNNVQRALATLAQLVVSQAIGFPSPLVTALVGLEKKYDIGSYFTQAIIIWTERTIKPNALLNVTRNYDADKSRLPKIQKVDTLREAVSRNDGRAISALVTTGADLEERTESGGSLLHLAIESGCLEALTTLLDLGADPNWAKNSEGVSPICLAATLNNVQAIDILVNRCVDINQQTPSGCSLLHEAASRGFIESINTLVRLGAKINCRNSNGQTPLHLAANNDVIRALVANGADVNLRSSTGDSALHIAVAEGRLEVVKSLLKSNVLVDICNNNEATPLLVAAQVGRNEVIQLLIDSGADINHKDSSENTSLQLAAGEGHLECVRTLLDAGLDVNTRDFGGRTPLHDSSSNGHLSVVQLLLQRGAEVDIIDCEGFTPLHLAAWTGSSQIVETLINAGSDINKRDGFYNRSPLEWAVIYKHTSTINILKSRGAVQ